jgi:hypothetical protein
MMNTARSLKLKCRGKLESILVVCVIVFSSLSIVIPMTAPNAKAYTHLGSTAAEDGDPTYDADGIVNKIVVWHDPAGSGEDHILGDSYRVDLGYTLNIPALDYMGDPDADSVIYFPSSITGGKMEVFGTLITNSGGPFTKTAFFGETGMWEGIYFHHGSSARITGCLFRGALKGLVFESGSSLQSDISNTIIDYMGEQGLSLDSVTGSPGITDCILDDGVNKMSRLLVINNVNMSITGTSFAAHASDVPQVHIIDSNVNFYDAQFYGMYRPGNLLLIEGRSNGTQFIGCDFDSGSPGDYYVQIDGVSVFMYDCSFITSNGQLSVVANDNGAGIPSSVTMRQPSGDLSPGFWDDSFDNSTIDATGNSNITLEWFMNVFVRDPDNNLIANAPVWVANRLGDPSQPPSQITQSDGWARWFLVKELILYNNSVDYFNPFNVSALNNSITGYASPDPLMNMSQEVTVEVPFNPVPNPPPIVSWITTPSGIQSNYITVNYKIEDPNPNDDGNLSIEVYYSTDGVGWIPATTGPGSDPLINLMNNTIYSFIMDSYLDIKNEHITTVYIKIIPFDRGGPGTPNQTGNFTVDNKFPTFLTEPVVTVTNNVATIEWTVDEPSNAKVQYGIGSPGPEKLNNSGTTIQSVTLTGLLPGRNYSYIASSTDLYGNIYNDVVRKFATPIYIQLYEGWNMISLAQYYINPEIDFQLSSIAGQYDAVQIYDSNDSDDPWKHYVPGKIIGNDLTYLYPDSGIWIKMKNDAILEVNHHIPQSGDPAYIIDIEFGWNFVGYPSVTTRTVTQALSSIVWDMVQMYDAATDTWYFNDGPGGDTDTMTQMELGRGYWIHCPLETGGIWSLSYI